MEVKLNIKTTESPEKVIFTHEVDNIILNKYYDLDGMIIDEGTEKICLQNNQSFTVKITEKTVTWHFEYTEDSTFIVRKLYINDQRSEQVKDAGEITDYRLKGKTLLLDCCTGNG